MIVVEIRGFIFFTFWGGVWRDGNTSEHAAMPNQNSLGDFCAKPLYKVRMRRLAETASSNFLFGCVVVWLLNSKYAETEM
jgi:hypothetical protein